MNRRAVLAHRAGAVLWTAALVPALAWWRDSVLFVIVASVWANVYAALATAEAADDRRVLDRLDRLAELLTRITGGPVTWSVPVPAGAPDTMMADQLADARAKWEAEWSPDAVDKYRGDVKVAADALLALTGPARTGYRAHLNGWRSEHGSVSMTVTASPVPSTEPVEQTR